MPCGGLGRLGKFDLKGDGSGQRLGDQAFSKGRQPIAGPLQQIIDLPHMDNPWRRGSMPLGEAGLDGAGRLPRGLGMQVNRNAVDGLGRKDDEFAGAEGVGGFGRAGGIGGKQKFGRHSG